jgi:hypothetical protein
MIKLRKMSGAYSTYGREEKCIQFWLDKLIQRDYSEDLGTDGRITLK